MKDNICKKRTVFTFDFDNFIKLFPKNIVDGGSIFQRWFLFKLLRFIGLCFQTRVSMLT